MTRWSRCLLFGALAVLVPALAGCEAGLNAPTLEYHPAAFGGYAVSPSAQPPYAPEHADLALALNRLSSAIYLMQVRYVGGHYQKRDERPLGPIRGWQPPPKTA